MRRIETIILHCSYTPPSMDIGAAVIKGWHVDGNGWTDIGYHFVLRRNGAVEEGRPLDVVGAHAKNFNGRSIGICLVGGMARSEEHTSELQSLMRISYAVFCLKKKTNNTTND